MLFAIVVFLQSSRSIVLASHDAVLRPTMTGWVEVRTGPVLPDVRFPSGARIGVDVYLGKTEAASTEALIERYAVIAGPARRPAGQGRPDALQDMVVSARAAGRDARARTGRRVVPVGKRRRRELAHRLRNPFIAAAPA